MITTHGKWSLPDVPHKGWSCVGISDEEEQVHLCEMCEAQLCRYVHEMVHDDYPDPLLVGCVCAGNMEQDLVGARKREDEFKLIGARRRRWADAEWSRLRNGNEFRLTKDGFMVVVFRRNDGDWAATVRDTLKDKARTSQLSYLHTTALKLAAYDVVEQMRRRRAAAARR